MSRWNPVPWNPIPRNPMPRAVVWLTCAACVLLTPNAYPCDCGEVDGAEALADPWFEVIFLGEVRSVRVEEIDFGGATPTQYERVEFDVELGWKGVDRRTVDIWNVINSTCHAQLTPGDRFIVLANSSTGLLEANDCTVYLLPFFDRKIPEFGEPVFVPGAASFRRGDANDDGVRDLTDGIRILNFLFLEGETPSCASAFDLDDDDRIVISDAVGLFNFLFLGGAPPQPPLTECGRDPTADELDCEAYESC